MCVWCGVGVDVVVALTRFYCTVWLCYKFAAVQQEHNLHDINPSDRVRLHALSSIIGPSHFDFMDDSSQAQVDGVMSALRLLRQLDTVRRVEDVIALVSSQS